MLGSLRKSRSHQSVGRRKSPSIITNRAALVEDFCRRWDIDKALLRFRGWFNRVETDAIGSPELDSEFESTFPSVPSHVTRSIDAAARLIETELPGWWWNCGHCALRNGASLYVPGSSHIRVNYPSVATAPDF